MALQVKPQIRIFVNNIKNTNTQAKNNNTSIGHSKFMYTYILRKSCQWSRAGSVAGWLGVMDKPRILTIQGSYSDGQIEDR